MPVPDNAETEPDPLKSELTPVQTVHTCKRLHMGPDLSATVATLHVED